MPKVLLINNYLKDPTKIDRLRQEIQRITGETPRIVDTSAIHRIDTDEFDAVVLSGGDAPLNRPQVAEAYSEAVRWIRGIRRPVLGICFGHQLLGFTFGGRVARLGRRFEGFDEVEVVEGDDLFAGMSDRIRVYKSNLRVVASVMPGFRLLAKGRDYEVEAFRHESRPIFGVQFHPENYSETYSDGQRVLKNFLDRL